MDLPARTAPGRRCYVILLALLLGAALAAAAAPAGRLWPTRLRGRERVHRPRIPAFAPGHILVKLDPRAPAGLFADRAGELGLRPFGRSFGGWVRVKAPPGVSVRAAVEAARRIPGALQVTLDPIVRLNDTIPRDPFFKDDHDPSSEPCDPFEDPECDATLLVDQWGLFKVGAPTAWDTERGSPEVVIAALDSGLDLDHDDMWGNVWTNPAETPDGLDNDGNGIVDDLHGADFCGDNVGDPSADGPAAVDGNPDVPQGGEWVEDEFAFPFGVYFDGDPAVGDAVDNDFDGWSIDAGVFHGTFVAGIAGAMTDNVNPASGEFEGVAGTAWNCRIMPVRMINAEGWGFGSDAAEAVRYAADMGADVINCSWGIGLQELDEAGQEEVAVIREAILYAAARGAICVAAAGNSGQAGTAVSGLDFPAVMREVISVGSCNWLDQRSEFSSTAIPGELPDNGVDDDGNGWIDDVLDVTAPGELIWSTYVLSAYDALLFQVLGDPTAEPGLPSYQVADGTSFATPLVAGYVGLILSHNPGATFDQVRQALRGSALDLTDPNANGQNLPGYDVYSGFGRVRMIIPDLEGGGAPTLAQLTVSPATVTGGTGAAGTVQLSGPAPAGGAEVALASTDPAAASVPAGVIVPAGLTTAGFTIATFPVTTAKSVSISGTLGVSRSAGLTILAPALSSLNLTPATVVGGNPSTGKVTLTGRAAAATAVALSETHPAASVPSQVTVPAGASEATFAVTTDPVTAKVSGKMKATLAGVTKQATLMVNPVSVKTLTFSPSPVVGSLSTTGTARLDYTSPFDTTVQLSSTNTSVAWPAVASILIPSGSISGTFTVHTAAVSTAVTVTIRATANGIVRSRSLKVNSVGVGSLALSPNPVTGGNASTGTVTLQAPAGPGAITVNLASSNTAVATVPASVTIPAGSSNGTFPVTTFPVTTTRSATITASANGTSKSASLSVRP